MTATIEPFHDLRSHINTLISSNDTRGFKSNKKVYQKVFNKSTKQSKAIDKFGDNYFYESDEDETVAISITIPRSMLSEVNDYCKKWGITRSRLIRKIIEYSLDLKKI